MRSLLRFQYGNTKLPKFIGIFGLPAGWTCPAASLCKSKAVENGDGTWSIVDGADAEFRCYAASDEVRYKYLRALRWYNFNLLKGLNKDEMVELINNSLPKFLMIIRIHDSGDMFNQDYFDAWLEVTKMNPEVRFYAYTKSINYWIARKDEIPANFILTASIGGKFDNLIFEHELNKVFVVLDEAEAASKGLLVDTDDSLAYSGTKEFALTIHNIQPKGSVWGKASYNNMKKKRELKKLKLAA